MDVNRREVLTSLYGQSYADRICAREKRIKYVLHPYLGYAEEVVNYQTDATTAVFGGSTALGIGGTYTIADHLGGVTFAANGYVAQQNVIRLLLHRGRLDRVIFLNGANEALSAILGDPTRYPMHFEQISGQWKRSSRGKWKARRRSSTMASLEAVVSLRSAWDNARQLRTDVVLVLQPYIGIGMKVLTPLEEKLLEQDLRNFPEIPEFYDQLRRMVRNVGGVDLCDVFKDTREHVYLDSCHFTDVGYHIIAKELRP